MKAKTETKNGYIYFAYEDYYGVQFGSWAAAEKNGEGPLYLVGYFYSYYYYRNEPIDEMRLKSRPTIGAVKQFIKDCKECIMEE
jgi:hypothetical protein